MKRFIRFFVLLPTALTLLWSCEVDDSLREYLDAHFWLPFSKDGAVILKKNVRRTDAPFAGMDHVNGNTPLATLRTAYQGIARQVRIYEPAPPVPPSIHQMLAAARADSSLTKREREEVDLIDAKIDIRAGDPAQHPEPLRSAETKLKQFLRTAQTPELLSEARGWLAHVYYLFGDRTAAGKIYLDELNRSGSNLVRETLLASLRVNYGYDGGQQLLDHLDEYFDKPEHAVFAIEMVTNPHWDRDRFPDPRFERPDPAAKAYPRIMALLEKHRDLLRTETGTLALLSMRTSLRMGDPPAALKIAAMVPKNSPACQDPDFLWMLASANFLSQRFAEAEQPLLELFRSSRGDPGRKAAAAYGLCGVYEKTHDTVEQVHFALWLRTEGRKNGISPYPSENSVYWAASGWDLGLLLDSEASLDQLQGFIAKYPELPDVRLVKYSLAVRLAREDRYEEAAALFAEIHANIRAPRMRQLAALYRDATTAEGKLKFAQFLSANPDRIYFNDAVWSGFQRYALFADQDSRFTAVERKVHIDLERKLKDDQEERWRAYLILRDIVKQEGKSPLGRQAAQLGIQCLTHISERFGRHKEIRQAEMELYRIR